MPASREDSSKKKASSKGRTSQKKSVRGPQERSPEDRQGGGSRSLRHSGQGLDPRQAIDDWLHFAQKEGHTLTTGKRRFDSDIDRVETFSEEERSLFQFCRSRSLSTADALNDLIKGPPTREGYEHRVFYHLRDDPPRVTKVTFPGKYGRIEHTPFLYLERLALLNALFPVLDVLFEDCVSAGDNEFSIVSSMRAFLGSHPELREIDAFLAKHGFSKLTEPSLTIDYTSREAGIHLRDCHPKNWIRSRADILIPIDVIPERIVDS
jgi:hypothetical protein